MAQELRLYKNDIEYDAIEILNFTNDLRRMGNWEDSTILEYNLQVEVSYTDLEVYEYLFFTEYTKIGIKVEYEEETIINERTPDEEIITQQIEKELIFNGYKIDRVQNNNGESINLNFGKRSI